MTAVKQARCPKLLLTDYDFSYLQQSSKDIQLTATIYEYSRASEPLRGLAENLESEGVYDDYRKLNPDAQNALSVAASQVSNAFTTDQLYWIAMWLKKNISFFQLRRKRLCPKLVGGTLFGTGLRQVQWSVVDMLRELQRNDPELNLFESTVALSIPWEFTDDELAKMFRGILGSLRPKLQPVPRKAGRRGRGYGFRAIDVLNQLGAWRLAQAGLNLPGAKARGYKAYEHQESWRKAVKQAQQRIDTLLTEPFWKR